MTTPHMTLVITTINVPTLLEAYAANFAKYGHLDHTSAIIVGDKKTPHDSVRKLAFDLRGRGFDCLYLDIPAQEQYLERFPRLKPLIPFNSDNRRNIGYLMAVQKGADILVAVDDDNYVMEEDWYAGHAHVGGTHRLETISCANGWFNPCQLMEYEPHCTVYARGYPYDKRWQPNKETYETTIGRVVLNGGLWLNDPDVDSLTRLSVPARGVSVRKHRVMLAPGTWSPINTQNTAFHRDTVPAFYFVPVGEPISGLPVERYGDIWAGFFVKKVIDHLNDRVTFGAPACDHRRNPHRLLHDLELEFWSVVLTDPLADALREWKLSGNTYCDCYAELADHLERTEWPHRKMAGEIKAFFGRMAAAMRIWVETCRQIGY